MYKMDAMETFYGNVLRLGKYGDLVSDYVIGYRCYHSN